MAKKVEQSIGEAIKEGIYRHVYRGPDEQIPSAVYDTIELLYKNYELKPFIFRKRLIENTQQLLQYKELLKDGSDDLPKVKVKTERQTLILPKHFSAEEILRFIKHRPKLKQTWFLVVHLPPGCEYSEFKSKEKHFASAVGGSCEIEKVGAAVYLTISNVRLERTYDFIFDPRPYMKKMHLPIFLGYSIDGPVVVDLAELMSILTGGLRGYGKSVLYHGIIYTLLKMNTDIANPYVKVGIADTKIGEFRYFEQYGACWTHEISDVYQMLLLIDEENERRQNIIGAKANNLLEYRALGKDLPFIVIVIDEAADLAEAKICKHLMSKAVRKYRSQGIFVLASTQRPDSKSWGGTNEFSMFKSQFEARISFKTADAINSKIILDDDKASLLPKVKGRAIFKYDNEQEIQVPYFPSRAKDPKQFSQLMDQLPQIPLPYDIEGEVIEHEPFYPCPRKTSRHESSSASRSLKLLESRTNPFA